MDRKDFRNLTLGLICVGLLVWGFLKVTADYEEFPGEMTYREGNYRLERGEYDRALECFKTVQKINPNFPPAYLGEALVHIQVGHYSEALKILNALIQKDPEFAEAWANRGIVFDHLGRYQEAIRDYRKALELKPDLAKGPGIIYRILHNISQKPSTIADRLRYLQSELEKPPEERLLRIPELDQQQPLNTRRRFL
ncbi:tetratricopeptide repeat protein [Thermosulfuriphilus sp.]